MSATNYSYRVSSVHCVACEQRLRKWFADDTQIEALTIDVPNQRVTFSARGAGLDAHFRSELHAAGYTADP
ncbi:MAG: hypothetical protein IPN63_14155 [Gammaproteobacteria bacterium]|nr:hypothetical protein [Gammaproteobacteria bacterium]MBK8132537.1 hypothetical protein [Gammaproteobacteria bacterium]MBK9428472.1 hypothetical protein [Gammaproteobacteria bacterium]